MNTIDQGESDDNYNFGPSSRMYGNLTPTASSFLGKFRFATEATDIVGIHGSSMMNMFMKPPVGNYTETAGAPVSLVSDLHCPAFNAHRVMVVDHRVSGFVGTLDPSKPPRN